MEMIDCYRSYRRLVSVLEVTPSSSRHRSSASCYHTSLHGVQHVLMGVHVKVDNCALRKRRGKFCSDETFSNCLPPPSSLGNRPSFLSVL